ncbi:ATP-binding protein, partial [Azotobacter chroococcum]|nr:ATP-binding protein [Azotobacter chroococcum]
FYTAARGDRGGPGTGLGLAICQGILGAHGGRVTVGEGLDGQGATLSLHLPLPLQPPGDAEHEYEPVTAP